jgi:galactokinase
MKAGDVSAQAIVEIFRKRYCAEPRLFYAPGRINLIGEHTDYNGGFVMPFAIDRGVTVAAARRMDPLLSIYSMELEQKAEIDITSPAPRHSGTWLDYVEGIVRTLSRRGVEIPGADILVFSSLAMGAGLASSAAFEIALAIMICGLAGQSPEPMEIVFAAQETEHQYAGTQSGIMDQYISMFGKSGSCLLLDCRSLSSHSIEFRSENETLVVCDTGVKHALATSEYNLRRAECEDGLRQIRRHDPNVQSLRDVSYDYFQQIENDISEPSRRRCRHVISENERTVRAAEALEKRNFKLLGQLMLESHRSLQIDYEVSCLELDTLVEASLQVDGVLGARMTGGGFGGCTINLMERAAVERFSEFVGRHYRNAFGASPAIFEVCPSSGAHEIPLASL